ncbi:HAD family hydrolase [Luteococcus sp.]|uniref:HAD family hydrolase n=1 Tax=Luteococcus sp. TaxID=1969402 RepID=UPI003734FA03
MITAAELFSQADLIMLDFDGPVTRLLPPPANAELAARAREAARDAGVPITDDLDSSTDHLAFIRAAGAHSPVALQAVESLCTTGEVAAALTSPVTPGAVDLLESANRGGKTVVIVTNNSPACVSRFVQLHDLVHHVDSIVGRDPRRPDLMKPDPHPLRQALQAEHAKAIMIGDSVSDAVAGTAAAVPVIALCKDSRRKTAMERAGAACTIWNLRELKKN